MLKDASLSVRIGTFVEIQATPALLSLVRAKACITLQSQLKQSILEGMYVPLCMVLRGIEFSSLCLVFIVVTILFRFFVDTRLMPLRKYYYV